MGKKSTLEKAHDFLVGHYPETSFSIVSEKIDFGDPDTTYDDVVTEMRMEGIKPGIGELESYFRSNKVKRVDEFHEYFNGLKYDDKTDYIDQLSKYVTTSNQDFWRSMFKKHLVRTVGQALGDGRFVNRFVLVLRSSKEFLGKSTFIRNLEPFGGEYYIENINGDEALALSKNFIINIEELESMNNTGYNKLKSWISSSTQNVRRLYSQQYDNKIRRCSFFASTNEVNFLEGGENTRWIIIDVLDIDFNYNNIKTNTAAIDINDVWAQAYHLWKTGYDYDLTPEEWRLSKEQSKSHEYKNEPQMYIDEYLNPSGQHDATSTEIANFFKIHHYKNFNAVAIGKALTQSGYEKSTRGVTKVYMIETKGGQNVNGYIPDLENDENKNNDDEKAPF